MKLLGKSLNRETYDLVMVTLVTIIISLLSIAIHVVDLIYKYLNQYIGTFFAEFFINFIFLYFMGLLWFTYHEWKQAEKKRKELEDYVSSMSANVHVSISENEGVEDRLYKLTLMDSLTGVYNRRGFFSIAENHLRRLAQNTKEHLLLLFIDVDGVKGINDKYGHITGDQALVESANVLKKTLRDTDIIARIGGDEFAILVTNVDESIVYIVIDRIKKKLEEINTGENRLYELSFSIGFAPYNPEYPCSIDELLSRADKMMYSEKKATKTM